MSEKYCRTDTDDRKAKNEECKPDNGHSCTSRRKGFSYSQAIERFIEDAEKGNFPIKFRKADCERVNGIARQLNSYHSNGQIVELQAYIARLFSMVVDQERING